MLSESTLQFIRENFQEFEPSNMDEFTEEIQEKLSPEDLFANIIENLEKYSTEKAEVILSNKSKLLSCLKTHYPIKIDNYEFGLSENLKPNKRLTVFEWNDRKRVREYSQRPDYPNLWLCRECFRMFDRVSNRGVVNSYPTLYYVSGIVFVPNEHNCKPMNYLLVMHYQKLLHEGNVQEARRMRQKINFIYGECDFSNIVNVLDETISASLPKNTTFSENIKEVNDHKSNSKSLKQKTESDNKNDSSSSDKKPPVHKKLRLDKSALKDTVADEKDVEEYPVHKKSKLKEKSFDIQTDDKCYSVIDKTQQKLKLKKKNGDPEKMYPSIQQDSETIDVEIKEVEPSSSATKAPIFSFQKPSTLMLKDICAKLKIKYSDRAEKLWKQIMFEQIDTVTTPEKY
uniref:Uncharacterized protein n=1 Tax=Panagrolaimus superbus TaxID=310955 RepID=A0A914YHT0_9BILA